MKGGQCRVDQTSDLLLTENDRQLQHFLGIGSFGHAPGPLECLDVEEAQSRQPLVHRIRCQLPLLEQCGLVLADVLRTQLIGGPVKVPGEVFDGANVTLDGGLSVVATLQFFEHDLAKMGHRETLLSLPATLDQLTPNCSPMTRASVRRSTASFKSACGKSADPTWSLPWHAGYGKPLGRIVAYAYLGITSALSVNHSRSRASTNGACIPHRAERHERRV